MKVVYPLQFSTYLDFTFTNSSLYLLVTTLLIFFVLGGGLNKATLVPSPWQSVVEFFYEFILGIAKQQAGPKGIKYFPLAFLLFVFILFSNLIGLLPLAFTTTAQVIVTLTLALSLNIGLIILGFFNHGLKFLSLFVPVGVPKVLMPLIIVIEVVSYLLRTFSLSIRLFANMMAGHTLLHILSSFSLGFAKTNFFVLSLLPFILVCAVIVLELGIAFLQAYVFVVLFCIYLNDSLNLH